LLLGDRGEGGQRRDDMRGMAIAHRRGQFVHPFRVS
jgi:hypothetical protein